MAAYTEADRIRVAATWAEDLREATRIMRRRQALRCAALALGAILMFSAGALFERLAGG